MKTSGRKDWEYCRDILTGEEWRTRAVENRLFQEDAADAKKNTEKGEM
jgi:hypothetical protein